MITASDTDEQSSLLLSKDVQDHVYEIKKRFVQALEEDHLILSNPDLDRPFSSIEDTIHRLLPYHVYHMPASDFEKLNANDAFSTLEDPSLNTNLSPLQEQLMAIENRLSIYLNKEIEFKTRDPSLLLFNYLVAQGHVPNISSLKTWKDSSLSTDSSSSSSLLTTTNTTTTTSTSDATTTTANIEPTTTTTTPSASFSTSLSKSNPMISSSFSLSHSSSSSSSSSCSSNLPSLSSTLPSSSFTSLPTIDTFPMNFNPNPNPNWNPTSNFPPSHTAPPIPMSTHVPMPFQPYPVPYMSYYPLPTCTSMGMLPPMYYPNYPSLPPSSLANTFPAPLCTHPSPQLNSQAPMMVYYVAPMPVPMPTSIPTTTTTTIAPTIVPPVPPSSLTSMTSTTTSTLLPIHCDLSTHTSNASNSI